MDTDTPGTRAAKALRKAGWIQCGLGGPVERDTEAIAAIIDRTIADHALDDKPASPIGKSG